MSQTPSSTEPATPTDADAFAAAVAAIGDDDGAETAEATEVTEAAPADKAPAEAQAEAEGDDKPADAPAGDAAAPEADGMDIASLMAKAQARRQEREAKAPEAAPAPLTADAIAKAVQSGSDQRYRSALEAVARGELDEAAKLTGVDPATIFERATKHGLNPGSVAAEDRIASLERELAALKDAKPSGVVTEEDFKSWQAAQVREQNNAAFGALVSGKDAQEAYPLLSRLAPDTALEYGAEAAQAMADAGLAFSVETAARYAEQIASKRLPGFANLIGSAPGAKSGAAETNSDAAVSSSATDGGNRASRTIDNRAASESATGAPDPWDDEAVFAAAIKAL
tara:strand:- start:37 stop:1056 length:1020 start_codon:yes stop_codon:yes gene_type:complete